VRQLAPDAVAHRFRATTTPLAVSRVAPTTHTECHRGTRQVPTARVARKPIVLVTLATKLAKCQINLYNRNTTTKGNKMQIIATYPDFKTATVLVDAWDIDRVTEAFFECGAIMVSTKEEE
jgi:hypothetical protein